MYNNNNSIVHHTAERTNPDVLMWDDTELVDTNNTNADVENCILEILDDWMVINDQSFIMYHYLVQGLGGLILFSLLLALFASHLRLSNNIVASSLLCSIITSLALILHASYLAKNNVLQILAPTTIRSRSGHLPAEELVVKSFSENLQSLVKICEEFSFKFELQTATRFHPAN